jgi:FtsP/CotA-like multicopper oxidase with cupredoxin domain
MAARIGKGDVRSDAARRGRDGARRGRARECHHRDDPSRAFCVLGSTTDTFRSRELGAESLDATVALIPTRPIAVERGKRYRLAFSNIISMVEHSMHLHGHPLRTRRDRRGTDERCAQGTSVVVRPMTGQVEIDVLADNPGTFLLHCHNELQMEGGLATTLSYRSA